MTSSVHPAPAPLRSGRAAAVSVLLAAIVRAVAITLAWWTVHDIAVTLATGYEPDARAAAYRTITTVGIALGISALALLVAGPVAITWLSRARVATEALSTAPHRLGRGWTVGSWLTPLANYVLPWVVVVDVWRASAPDPTSRPTPVHGWWIATVAARLAHLSAWVVVVQSFGGDRDSAESTWTIAVLHTAGALLGLVAAGLFALTVVEVDRGVRGLAARRHAVDPGTAVKPAAVADERRTDPLLSDGPAGFVGRIVGTIRRSGRHLLVLDALTAAASTAGIMFYDRATAGPAGGWTPGDPPQFLTVLAPVSLLLAAAFLLVRSATLVVILRQAAGQAVSIGHAVRDATRRTPALFGWVLLIIGVFFGIAYLGYLTGSLLVLALVTLPATVVMGVILNLTLVGVVTVEGASIVRCFALVRGQVGVSVVRFLSVLPLLLVFSIATDVAETAIGNPVARAVVLTLIALPFYVFVSAFTAVVYAHMRYHHSGGRVLSRHLVAQLDDPEHRVPDAVVRPTPSAPATGRPS